MGFPVPASLSVSSVCCRNITCLGFKMPHLQYKQTKTLTFICKRHLNQGPSQLQTLPACSKLTVTRHCCLLLRKILSGQHQICWIIFSPLSATAATNPWHFSFMRTQVQDTTGFMSQICRTNTRHHQLHVTPYMIFILIVSVYNSGELWCLNSAAHISQRASESLIRGIKLKHVKNLIIMTGTGCTFTKCFCFVTKTAIGYDQIK